MSLVLDESHCMVTHRVSRHSRDLSNMEPEKSGESLFGETTSSCPWISTSAQISCKANISAFDQFTVSFESFVSSVSLFSTEEYAYASDAMAIERRCRLLGQGRMGVSANVFFFRHIVFSGQNKILEVKRKSDRVMSIKLVVEKHMLNIISACTTDGMQPGRKGTFL